MDGGFTAFLAGLAAIAGVSCIPLAWGRAALGALCLLTLAAIVLQSLT